MNIVKQTDITYQGENVSAHRLNDSVTVKNKYHLIIGFSLDDAKELYDVLGRLVSDASEEK